MAQHDYIIANQSGAAFRADLNNSLAAIVSQNSGAAQPSTTYAYQWWADTTTGLLKIRNAGNNAWITLFQLDGEWATLALENGTAAAPSLYFKDSGTDTGLFSPGADVVAIATGGVERVRFTSTGAVFSADVRVPSINGGPLAGTRNAVINGAMATDQRNVGTSQTFTAAAALAYSVDRWYGYCTGANVTGQRVQGATAGQFRYQFTGAASVTAIGFGQRIEQLNSADLAGTTATLSVDLANSVLTTVTWTAFYATTADTFGTLASPTRTQIATGTFTVNSTIARYSANISVPGAATTGIEIVFTVGAQTSGTWTIGDVQLERGTVATPFERRPIGAELALCQRYYETLLGSSVQETYSTGVTDYIKWTFKTTKRANPTVTGANVSFNTVTNLAATVDMVVFNGANAYCWWQNAAASTEL
jgi:hypothetical protein